MKPGWKTTEFWLSVMALLVGALIASGAFADGGTLAQVLAFAASALTALGYTVARGLAKKGEGSTHAVLKAKAEGVNLDPS